MTYALQDSHPYNVSWHMLRVRGDREWMLEDPEIFKALSLAWILSGDKEEVFESALNRIAFECTDSALKNVNAIRCKAELKRRSLPTANDGQGEGVKE